MVKRYGLNDISLFFSKYVIIDFHHFYSKPLIMVTMIKLKKIGILLLLNWHKMAKKVFCVKVGDFNNFTDFTDVADFTNFKALFEPCHSNGCKVVDFTNLFWL